MKKRITVETAAAPLLAAAPAMPTPAGPPLPMADRPRACGAETRPSKFLNTEALADKFKKRGVPFPHRNSLLLAEKQGRFPARFHLDGSQWSRAYWIESEVDAFFSDAVKERPLERWKPRAELEKELAELRGAL